MRKNRILVLMMTLALTVSAISCRRTENRETEIEPTATGGSKETTAVQATTQTPDENDKEPAKDQPSEGFPEMKLVTTELGQKILDGLDIMTINEVLADISVIDLAGYEASGLETSTTNVKTASGLTAKVEYQRDEADGEVNHFLTITTDHYTVDFYKLDHTAPYGGKHISLTMYSLTDEAPFQECAAFGYGDYYDEEEAKDYAEISMIEYLDEEGSYCIYTPPFYDEEEYVTVEVEKENCTADTELLQVLAVEPAVNEIALSISNGTKYYYNDAGEWFVKGTVVVSFTDADALNTFFKEYADDRMEPDLMDETCLTIRSMIIPVYDDVLIDGDHFEYFVTSYLDESFFSKLHLDEEGKVYELSRSSISYY